MPLGRWPSDISNLISHRQCQTSQGWLGYGLDWRMCDSLIVYSTIQYIQWIHLVFWCKFGYWSLFGPPYCMHTARLQAKPLCLPTLFGLDCKQSICFYFSAVIQVGLEQSIRFDLSTGHLNWTASRVFISISLQPLNLDCKKCICLDVS